MTFSVCAPHAGCAHLHSAENVYAMRRLIRLRREASGPAEVSFDENACWLMLWRGRLLAVFNFGEAAQVVPRLMGNWRIALASDVPAGPTGSSGLQGDRDAEMETGAPTTSSGLEEQPGGSTRVFLLV